MHCLAPCLLAVALSCSQAVPVVAPAPYGVVPSARQLRWHELEFYGFVHFTMNTFTDLEWGYGDEDLGLFQPTDFSAEQIVSVAKMAGMKGLILTCKHHDGFCLWPSAFTQHSVKNTPWKAGQGDMVREFADACKAQGLLFGVYLSPWDRNHADYGKPAYVAYYRQQLRELLSNYGPIFEVWWDGANGGDGYYAGARESRTIERGTYYDWDRTAALVRELQPDAVIFSDAGPDVRWIGNEHGVAGDSCWATYTPVVREGETKVGPGTTQSELGNEGHRNGAFWLPGEADVSIRPGWFYHATQDDQVRSAANLLDLYYQSVGRGSSFLLNLPPDRRGRIHDNDIASLSEFQRVLKETFATNLAVGAQLTASNVRGNSENYATAQLIDGNRSTFWCTEDDLTTAELIVSLPQVTAFNVVDFREYLPLGQRVATWALDSWQSGAWVEFAAGTSIGNRRLWRGEELQTSKVRLRLNGAACPAISEFGLYAEPR